jgi:hypothetical protein
VTAQQQALAAQSMGLTFPSSTQYLLFERQQGMDEAIHLKIQLSAAALQQLIDQKPFAGADWSTTQRSVYDMPDVPQWRPTEVARFRSGQLSLPKAEVLNVLIDDADDTNKIIYLMWHQT